ncbi:hypothetical protein FPOAC1_011306 [Fusarium poae]|uniref:hypothetical protein n=1 Tax=Fusarium poae TaxID=36050 RepID=UPI001CE8DC04|nr:hypothetical protein FPOAC1_011306 [Fusarium poae]KAG8666498.1 hypothetical protein FPOAC1_011306 [Fusarium poae]
MSVYALDILAGVARNSSVTPAEPNTVDTMVPINDCQIIWSCGPLLLVLLHQRRLLVQEVVSHQPAQRGASE